MLTPNSVPIMANEDKPKPRPSATGTLVGTRFQVDLLSAIDAWRKEQHDLPTRPEAVRRLVELGMACDGGKPAAGRTRHGKAAVSKL